MGAPFQPRKTNYLAPDQLGVAQTWGNPKMGRPGKWKQGLKRAVLWWFDLDRTETMTAESANKGHLGAGKGVDRLIIQPE